MAGMLGPGEWTLRTCTLAAEPDSSLPHFPEEGFEDIAAEVLELAELSLLAALETWPGS